MNFGDSGSASRFFYCAKVSPSERMGSSHPTMKPIALMKYLVTLCTREGATIVDPFAGSGTTGVAAMRLKRKAVLIEWDSEYCNETVERLSRERNLLP